VSCHNLIYSNYSLPIIRFAFFQDENNVYLLLEYVAGGELYSHLRKRKTFTEPLAKFYAVEIASALECMHNLDIAYRDIKPENILIAADGHVRITDFGFAKIVKDLAYTSCGTPEYLAPEIVEGKGHGRAVDWYKHNAIHKIFSVFHHCYNLGHPCNLFTRRWALGVLLFEMLAGYPPFAADNPFGIYQQILRGRVRFPSSISISAQRAIAGFLTVDRKKRLGCSGKGGVGTLRSTRFFKGINWASVAMAQLVPPFQPEVTSEGDTSNFDQYQEQEVDEVSNLSEAERKQFSSFDEILGRVTASVGGSGAAG